MFDKTQARRDLRRADELRSKLKLVEQNIDQHRFAFMTESGLKGVNTDMLRREVGA